MDSSFTPSYYFALFNILNKCFIYVYEHMKNANYETAIK